MNTNFWQFPWNEAYVLLGEAWKYETWKWFNEELCEALTICKTRKDVEEVISKKYPKFAIEDMAILKWKDPKTIFKELVDKYYKELVGKYCK